MATLAQGFENDPVEPGADIDRPQFPPSLDPFDRKPRRGPRSAGSSLVDALRAPVDRRVVARWHELDEVEPVAFLPSERARREIGHCSVPLREVGPEADRWPIHLSGHAGGPNPFLAGHLACGCHDACRLSSCYGQLLRIVGVDGCLGLAPEAASL